MCSSEYRFIIHLSKALLRLKTLQVTTSKVQLPLSTCNVLVLTSTGRHASVLVPGHCVNEILATATPS